MIFKGLKILFQINDYVHDLVIFVLKNDNPLFIIKGHE